MTTFRMDGPHSPETVQQAADLIAEGLRYLVLATRAGQDGLTAPEDAYALLGALCTATERFPQLTAQISAFLDVQLATGRLADSGDADPGERTTVARLFLANAGNRAGELTAGLREAQNAISGLSVKKVTPTLRNNLRGHALQSEGRPYRPGDESYPWVRVNSVRGGGTGVALCECGVTSEVLESDNARKRWHRDVHKPEIRNASKEQPDG